MLMTIYEQDKHFHLNRLDIYPNKALREEVKNQATNSTVVCTCHDMKCCCIASKLKNITSWTAKRLNLTTSVVSEKGVVVIAQVACCQTLGDGLLAIPNLEKS